MAKVFIEPKAARQFRRAAWAAFPKEYIAAAYGQVHASGAVEVAAFGLLPHTATRTECEFGADAVTECRRQVLGSGLYYLGTMHSHPNCIEPSPSMHDWTNAEVNDLLMGVCALWLRNGRRCSSMQFFDAKAPYIRVATRKEMTCLAG